MRFHVLATDYDGTLARHGSVDPAVVDGLDRLAASGRRLVLVTGRQLPDLAAVFDRVERFDLVVAENGGVLYDPATREETSLADPPPAALVDRLRAKGVERLSIGRVVAATWEPHEVAAIEAIRELGLEHQVIFNKGAVMILPPNVNKATGLAAALLRLGLSPHNAVGVGDAENDHAFLRLCEAAVAVGNALPTVKETADLVTRQTHGDGVAELVQALLTDDLASLEARLTRHHLPLGVAPGGEVVTLPPAGENVLIAGPSGSGKSTLVTAFVEELLRRRYQFGLVDPEGDYERLGDTVPIGTGGTVPSVAEVVEVLDHPDRSAVVNLLAIDLDERPGFFLRLFPALQDLRARTGRPHWTVIDEAHHLMPAEWHPVGTTLPRDVDGLLLITVHPDLVAPPVLETMTVAIAVGPPDETLAAVARAWGVPPPGPVGDVPTGDGHAVIWFRGRSPVPIDTIRPAGERLRHRRKYATGQLSPDDSFYFRGPEGRLNLRAQNLALFAQLARGVDTDTWLHHLRVGDYSTWIRGSIKDPELADEVATIEHDGSLSAEESLEQVVGAIGRRYAAV